MRDYLPLFHLGIILVGIPSSEQRLFSMYAVGGGSPYGDSSVSGPMADRMPTEDDLEIAKTRTGE